MRPRRDKLTPSAPAIAGRLAAGGLVAAGLAAVAAARRTANARLRAASSPTLPLGGDGAGAGLSAAHQLRGPLTALMLRLEEIQQTARTPSVRDEAAAALEAAQRLAGVVDSFLAERARVRPVPELIDAEEILDQQQAEWQPAFRRAGRALTVAGCGGLKVAASPDVLAQVVATLLDNALTHGAGAVELRARHLGGRPVVEISDEGPGVPDEFASRIFERSYSGDGGTGLGLWLARDLIEADGGRLALTRPRPPTFTIYFAARDS